MTAPRSTPIHATTVVSVRHRGRVAVAGDGQVSVGQTIMKAGARKVRKVYHDRVLAGFAGAAAGLAGGVIASSAARGNLTYGTDLDFNAIAAVLVGGISINGGRGRISDAVVGAVFLGVISNILLVSGVSYEFQLMVKGSVVLGAVVFGVFAARTARR